MCFFVELLEDVFENDIWYLFDEVVELVILLDVMKCFVIVIEGDGYIMDEVLLELSWIWSNICCIEIEICN